MIPIFIGYDSRQRVSYNVLQQSIIEHSTRAVSITPLVLDTLPCKRQGLTPFTYSRFLVPWLCRYEGWAIFMDSDILLCGDIAELWTLRDECYTLMVSKNKLRFEWPSVMLFNCGRCEVLTPDFIKAGNPLALKWLPEAEIGNLPSEWNHLVGYDTPRDDAKLVHYTQGIPVFPETKDSEYAEEWQRIAKISMSSISWAALMGNSVHAQPVLQRLSIQPKE